MKKRWLKIGIVGLAVVLTATIFLSRPGPRFADTISFLEGKRCAHAEDVINLPRLSFSAAPRHSSADYVWTSDTFNLDEPFDSLNERAKKELKPRAVSASSYPAKKPTFQLYSFTNPKTGMRVNLSLVSQSSTRTTVSVTEYRDASWLDRAKSWVRNLAHPSQPKLAIHY